MHWSLDKSGHFVAELIDSGWQTHVHELGLGVHLETTHDGRVGGEFELEFFARVLGVGLKSGEDLVLFAAAQSLGRDDGNLLFFV